MFLSKNLKSNRNCLQPTSKFLLPNFHVSTLKAHNSKGITLVALVVTIIVLLILAGVTITSLLGDDGIISKAQQAADATNTAVDDEIQAINNLGDKMNSILTDGGSDSGSDGLSSQDIANGMASNPSDYYGKIVSGYTCTNSSAVANWKIFYAGNDFSADSSYHVYLIADDYIPRANIPNSSAGHALNAGSSSYPRAAYFTNILNDYSGSASITDNNIKKLNNDFFTKGYSSSYDNMKSVAYMLDTNAWSVYKGEDADYAVGGPSIEMLMKSYSQAHNVDYRAQASSTTGYQISNNGGSSWANYYSGMLSTSDSLYVITSQSNALGYWVSSPSAYGNYNVMGVYYDGRVDLSDSSSSNLGFRPLVCLSSDVKFEQLSNGNFQIK